MSTEFGATAHEGRIRDLIADEIKENVDDITIDNLGNLIAFKKGKLDKEKIMISVPMDQICFIVTHIEEPTKYKFSMLNTVNLDSLVNASVVFENGVKGTILEEESRIDKNSGINKLYIKTSKEDEKRYGAIKLGKVCVLDGEYMESNYDIRGVALYPRAGCSIIANVIKSVSEVENDVYFVFTAHGMLEARGAVAAVHSINPTIGIGIGAAPSNDNVKLGKGPVIVCRDRGTVSHRDFVSSIEDIAKKTNIPFQKEVSKNIYSDSMGILKAGCNCKIVNISFPINNMYSNCEIVYKEDLALTEKLLIEYIG
jgi:endoglucanase